MWPPLSRTTPSVCRSCPRYRGCRAGRWPPPARSRRPTSPTPAPSRAGSPNWRSRLEHRRSLGRCRMMQTSLVPRPSSASSSGCGDTTRPGSIPQLAERMTSAWRRRCGSPAPWRRSRRTPPSDGANARAGQHGDRRLRHHRHVEDDAVALLDPNPAACRRAPVSVNSRS